MLRNLGAGPFPTQTSCTGWTRRIDRQSNLMANSNAPYGLRFIGLNGSPPVNASLRERRNAILSTNTTAIYTGDLIKISANGYLYQWTATTAAYLCYGVFMGCRYASNSQQTIVPQKYWPGTDAASGTVLAQYYSAMLSPSALFVIQTDATGITVADIGANADIAVGTGSTTTGFSGSYLDTSTLTTATTAPLRIVDLWANWSMAGASGGVEGAGTGSSLAAGTQAGAYNWAVVALNNVGAQGV